MLPAMSIPTRPAMADDQRGPLVSAKTATLQLLQQHSLDSRASAGR